MTKRYQVYMYQYAATISNHTEQTETLKAARKIAAEFIRSCERVPLKQSGGAYGKFDIFNEIVVRLVHPAFGLEASATISKLWELTT